MHRASFFSSRPAFDDHNDAICAFRSKDFEPIFPRSAQVDGGGAGGTAGAAQTGD
jgi:hypothetical protein